MLKIIFGVIFLALLFNGYSKDITIKSLRAYSDTETSFPIVTPLQESNQRLTIEFDVASETLPNLNIVFRYCDRNWNPYNNIFLANNGKNIEYDLDFEVLPFTCEDARYHYKGFFPNENNFVEFPFSGKWMFFITDVVDTSLVYATGKFYVVYNDVELKLNIKKEMLEERAYNPIALGRIFNLTSSFELPEGFYPSYVGHVEIIANRRLSSPLIVDRTFNTNARRYSWNGDREFSFTVRDIYPGNEYRQADLRDANKFIGKAVNAQFDGFDMSRFYKLGKRDLNGSFVLTNYKSENATYLDVTFRVQPPEEFYGDIFLVGSFNDWIVSQDFLLSKLNGIYSISLPLKRGIYDYQYVTGYVDNGRVKDENWIYLEGNFWETVNEYYVFLYYYDPNYGGYDKIIGFNKIISK